jgi:hypothetical protein
MTHRRRFVLTSTVALVTCAGGASSALAALPEFMPPTEAGIESVLKASHLETVGKTIVKCKKGGDGGAITGPKTVRLTITFVECSIPGALCTTSGKPFGVIETAPLTGELGYIHKSTKVVGLDLFASGGGPFATFECGATPFVVIGSVIGRIAPVNKVVNAGEHFTLKFAEKEGLQKPPSFEGAPPDVLSTSIGGGPFETTGLAATDEVFVIGTVEIKA